MANFTIKMALIKYYYLESRSQETVSELERNLQKYLLNEKHVNAVLATPAPAVVDAMEGNGNVKDLERSIYDSGEFDVLYKHSWEIAKGKKRIFRKEIAPRLGVELVVSATPEEIIQLQEYLSSSQMEVVEARGVSKACFTFTSQAVHDGAVKNYKAMIEKYVADTFPNIKIDLKIQEKVIYEKTKNSPKESGATCTGLISGSVEDVLHVRALVLNNGSTISTRSNRTTFSK